jgi:hypothetical protein
MAVATADLRKHPVVQVYYLGYRMFFIANLSDFIIKAIFPKII